MVQGAAAGPRSNTELTQPAVLLAAAPLIAVLGIVVFLVGVGYPGAVGRRPLTMMNGWENLSARHVSEILDGCAVLADALDVSHVLSVPLRPTITAGVIILAVVLALAGGLLAGAFGSWRIAGLRPADALARVA